MGREGRPPKKGRGKMKLFLAGSGKGPPTAEDLTALYEALTGRKATAEEIERARKELSELEQPSLRH